MFSNKHHFDSFIDITFKTHDGNQKVLNTLCVQFYEKILNFEGEVMVQPSGTFFFGATLEDSLNLTTVDWLSEDVHLCIYLCCNESAMLISCSLKV